MIGNRGGERGALEPRPSQCERATALRARDDGRPCGLGTVDSQQSGASWLGRNLPDCALVQLERGTTADDAHDAQGFAAGGADRAGAEGGIGQADLVPADLVEVALDEAPPPTLGVLEEVLPALAVYGDDAVSGH